MVKNLLVAVVMAAFFSSVQANPDFKLSASLGSMVGEVEGAGTCNIPFWTELTGHYEGFYGGVGHRSTADCNGNEVDYEYLLIGYEYRLGKLFAGVEIDHSINNDLKHEEIYGGEVGVVQYGIKFGLWYEQNANANFRTQGVRAAFVYDL